VPSGKFNMDGTRETASDTGMLEKKWWSESSQNLISHGCLLRRTMRSLAGKL